MSTADRAAAIKKYSAMFDTSEDEAALADELGTPTKLAISLARSYVPGAMQEELVPAAETSESVPGAPAAEEAAPPAEREAPVDEPAVPETPSEEQGTPSEEQGAPAEKSLTTPAEPETPAEDAGPVFGEGAELNEEQARALEQLPDEEKPAAPPDAPAPKPVPDEPDRPRRTLRAGGAVLAIYTVFAIIIGLPVAVVLIAVGLPFLLLGAGVIAAAAYSVVSVVPLLGMFSDILLVSGAGLVFCAVGLVLAWLGAWISISLGGAWIGGAVLSLGRRLCWKEAR